jgi:hypothetical protein
MMSMSAGAILLTIIGIPGTLDNFASIEHSGRHRLERNSNLEYNEYAVCT